MPEKKCPECAMMIAAEARRCPHCRAKQSSITWWRAFLIVAGGCMLLAFVCYEVQKPSEPPAPAPAYTDEQIQAAETYWDGIWKTGLIKELAEGERSIQIVYVNGRMWKALPFEQKKQMLGLLAKAHMVRGYTDNLVVKDHRSGEVYAECNPPYKIEVYK